MSQETNLPPLDEDELDIEPWPPIELLGRATALATLVRRLSLEIATEDLDEDAEFFDLETQQFDLAAWARTELISWITDDELQIITTELNILSDDDHDTATDALIAGVTIMWALSVPTITELPILDGYEQESLLLDWAPKPWEHVRPLLKRVHVRSIEELSAERERWELWYWRSSFPDMLDDEAKAAIAEAAEEASELGLIEAEDGDFLVNGRPYMECSELERNLIAADSASRLRALNWVCGLGETWESTPFLLD